MPFGNTPCPIEFPPTCEIRVNQIEIAASTNGMKKPGTAPPVHLGNSVRVSIGAQNRLEMVYVNSQANSNQPPPSPKVCFLLRVWTLDLMFQQKYYMVVILVEVTTIGQLIEGVKKGRIRTRKDILAQRTCPMTL